MVSTVPVVDFSALSLSTPDDKLNENDVNSTAEQLINALINLGAVYLQNVGFPQRPLENLAEVAQEFFQLPEETKKQYAYGGKAMHGWIALGQESGDLNEMFEINLRALHEPKRWPQELPQFKCVTMECFKLFSTLAHRLLLTFDHGLNLERCHNTFSRPGSSNIRILSYPPVLEHKKLGQMRSMEHTDYGTLTLLIRGDKGLQIKTRDGMWIDADPPKNAILVLAADMMQRWTADRILATSHRVVIPDSDEQRRKVRRSTAFFLHPDSDFIVKCLDGSDTYQPVTDAEYYMQRAAETFGY